MQLGGADPVRYIYPINILSFFELNNFGWGGAEKDFFVL